MKYVRKGCTAEVGTTAEIRQPGPWIKKLQSTSNSAPKSPNQAETQGMAQLTGSHLCRFCTREKGRSASRSRSARFS